MANTAPVLLQGTRIWVDNDTKKECQAPNCLRWADVRHMEQDINAGLVQWEYTGPITYVVANDTGYHLLGEYSDWQVKWQEYSTSAQALLLAHN
jgi:hypothetical protein